MGADPDGDGDDNQKEWLALTDPNDAADFLVTALRYDGSNVEIDLPGRPNRGITVQHSTDLINWTRWGVLGNDGIPRNPAGGPHTLFGTSTGQKGFFRLYLQEK